MKGFFVFMPLAIAFVWIVIAFSIVIGETVSEYPVLLAYAAVFALVHLVWAFVEWRALKRE